MEEKENISSGEAKTVGENQTADTEQLAKNKTFDPKIFEPILDKDEVVQKIYKPKKSKMFWSTFFFAFVTIFWVGLIIGFILGSIYGEAIADEIFEMSSLAFVSGFLGTIAVLYVFEILFFFLAYKNTYYAYTNKRVIVRKGIFGVDYKSLDMTMIGAVTVNVSLLDKMVKNTGSIFFGSMANPISANNQIFKFANIENPYEVYKEIKSVIDSKKNN